MPLRPDKPNFLTGPEQVYLRSGSEFVTLGLKEPGVLEQCENPAETGIGGIDEVLLDPVFLAGVDLLGARQHCPRVFEEPKAVFGLPLVGHNEHDRPPGDQSARAGVRVQSPGLRNLLG